MKSYLSVGIGGRIFILNYNRAYYESVSDLVATSSLQKEHINDLPVDLVGMEYVFCEIVHFLVLLAPQQLVIKPLTQQLQSSLLCGV